MRVKDIMHADLKTAEPDSAVRDAIMVLADGHIAGLPVVDRDGQLIGVLSTSDILSSVTEVEDADACNRLFENTLVEELMTPIPRTISADAELQDAAQRMLYLDVHRLLVIDGSDRLVGVVSQSDIVQVVATAKI